MLGISPNSSPRDVAEDALDAKELEKLPAALLFADSSDVALRKLGRKSSSSLILGSKKGLTGRYEMTAVSTRTRSTTCASNTAIC